MFQAWAFSFATVGVVVIPSKSEKISVMPFLLAIRELTNRKDEQSS
jgi:hypothetical protein